MTVVIVATPSRNPDGSRAYSTRGQLFNGTVDGKVVIERSHQPFLDGARRLIGLGHDPEAILIMQYLGSDAVALRGQLSTAAGLTVDEASIPRFKRWKPWGGDAAHASNPETSTGPPPRPE